MPRRPRSEAAGLWFHVFNRGARRQDIFLDDGDRRCFLGLLNEVHQRHGVEVHAFCLLDNHFHLVLHCPERNLSEAMHWMATVYAQRFNRRHGLDGPMFRSRFAAKHISDDRYLLDAVRYVHRNPEHHGLGIPLDRYQWSAHRTYLGLVPQPKWLETGVVKALLTTAGDNYPSMFDHATGAGSPPWLVDLEADCESLSSIDDVEAAVLAVVGGASDQFRHSTPGLHNEARALVLLLSWRVSGLSDNDLTARYGASGRSVITSMRRRAQQRLETNGGFRLHYEACVSRLADAGRTHAA